MNKKKNRFDFCRTCGKTGDVEIFGPKGEVLQLEEKINTYLPITVNSNTKSLYNYFKLLNLNRIDKI